MDLYAHAQTVDTKRSSPIFRAPGYEANPGKGLDQTKKVEKGEGEISGIANLFTVESCRPFGTDIFCRVDGKQWASITCMLKL